VYLVLVVVGVTFLTYNMLSLLPGDTADAVCGISCDETARQQVREQLGLDRPPVLRYVTWLGNAVTGDLGQSARSKQDVTEALSQRLPVTLELLIYAEFIALVVAIPAGLLAAARQGGLFDRGSTATAFFLLSIPPFVLGLVLSLIFAVNLKWFPATGYTPFFETAPDIGELLALMVLVILGVVAGTFAVLESGSRRLAALGVAAAAFVAAIALFVLADMGSWFPDPSTIAENLRSFFLPSLTIAVAELAVYMRLLRSDLISTLQEDYITMAKAKGLPPSRIMLKHAFRPSTFSLITIGGLNVGRLIGGTIIVEVMFALNGLGKYLIDGILGRDYIPVLGAVLVVAIGYVLVNFAVDLLYAVLDPRIRHARAIA
jgi:peptide/nickel transport system permease protein